MIDSLHLHDSDRTIRYSDAEPTGSTIHRGISGPTQLPHRWIRLETLGISNRRVKQPVNLGQLQHPQSQQVMPYSLHALPVSLCRPSPEPIGRCCLRRLHCRFVASISTVEQSPEIDVFRERFPGRPDMQVAASSRVTHPETRQIARDREK